MIDREFWKGRRVFLTGHTGFKGAWLSLWLHSLGSEVTGYALDPPTVPSLYDICGVGGLVKSVTADVRDGASLALAMAEARPEVVIHMAAQPLVRGSYKDPVETYSINVMGTVNMLEAVRGCKGVRAVINVTTDKCYENKECLWGYSEDSVLGGYDPYSNSKACSELVTAAYRTSYFHPAEHKRHGVGVASARAGNVIGGGDWAKDRLVPDCIRALLKGETIRIRSPRAVRPWQHVLEPLRGYLMLAQKLYEDGPRFSEPWNFGPDDADAVPVDWLVAKVCALWGGGASYEVDPGAHLHEALYLKLDCSKTKALLRWRPVWDIEKALDSIVHWARCYKEKQDLQSVCLQEISAYASDSAGIVTAERIE